MARTRTGGTTAYAVALVLFVILFVFSTVIAILLYTRLSTAERDSKVARDSLREVARQEEINGLKAQLQERLRADPNRSLVGLLQDENRYLKGRIANLGDQPREAVDAEIKAALYAEGRKQEEIDATTLVTEIRTLRETAAFQEGEAGKAKAAQKAAEDRAAAAEAQLKTVADSYQASIAQLTDRVTQQANQIQAFQELVGQQRTQLETRAVEVQKSRSDQLADAQRQIAERDTIINELRDKIREYENRRASFEGIKPELQADGEVASILTDQNLVYINRGRQHHVLPGMTFEVFDKTTGVTPNAVGDIRGKATVEVININDTSSVARVVRQTRGAPLVEGDLIVNAVYDPNQTFKFVVFGEFDIDNTGQPTVSDRRRIETMITEWGGKLVDQMTYDTDFLVLGQEPTLPDPLPENTIDPVAIERHAAETRRYQTYQELVAQARELKIPVLNQNRFLALVGYYKR